MFAFDLLQKIHITQIQYAHKNKDFHYGSIKIDNYQFNYIYDCGLTRKEIIDFLKDISKIIDIIFISHFHRDHIAGILDILEDEIFKNTKFVIPLHKPRDKYLYGAVAYGEYIYPNNNFVNRYMNFLNNENVIWVNSRNSNANYDLDYHITNRNYNNFNIGNENQYSSNRNRNNYLYTLNFQNELLNWIFLTHSICNEKELDAYWNNLYNDNPNLKDIAENIPEQGAVRNEFSNFIKEWNNTKTKYSVRGIEGDKNFENLISLCLYAGPYDNFLPWLFNKRNQRFKTIIQAINPNLIMLNKNIGWMHTGDSNLKDEILFNKFKSSYSCIKDNIRCITLPHHGSINNYNSELIKNYASEYVLTTESTFVKKYINKIQLDSQSFNKKLIDLSQKPSFTLEYPNLYNNHISTYKIIKED